MCGWAAEAGTLPQALTRAIGKRREQKEHPKTLNPEP